MDESPNKNTDLFIKNSRKLIEAISAYKKLIEYFDSQDEESIKFKDTLISMLNEDIMTSIKCIEEQTYILADKLFIINPESASYYKIDFNKPPQSNPDPGESQDH